VCSKKCRRKPTDSDSIPSIRYRVAIIFKGNTFYKQDIILENCIWFLDNNVVLFITIPLVVFALTVLGAVIYVRFFRPEKVTFNIQETKYV